jgi:hypothetical protein
VIYAECQGPLWLDIASLLAREHGLRPCYWVAKRQFEPALKARFPDIVFHHRSAAIRGQPAPACADMRLRPLDAAILRRFSFQLLTAGKMMDRLDAGDAFRYEERTRLFHVHLRYWRTVLDRVQPVCAIFPVQPHTVYDYILYELCQDRGIPTVMFQWTLFHDTFYAIDHIDRGYRRLGAAYRERLAAGSLDSAFSAQWETYLQRVAGQYRDVMPRYLTKSMPEEFRQHMSRQGAGAHEDEGDHGLLAASCSPAPSPPTRVSDETPRVKSVPWRKRLMNLRRQAKIARKRVVHARRQLAQTARRLSPGRLRKRARDRTLKLRSLYRRWIRPVIVTMATGDLDRPLKERNRRMEESFAGRLGALRFQRYRFRGRRVKQRLLERYKALSTPVKLDVPYVFVALHYQPEQTTCPTGGVFMDQYLMVELLSGTVPEGWLVYVKEHPFQFSMRGIGERGRVPEFYDDLVALPNVRLVPWTTAPFGLIDNARAVATVTGTSGTEAVIRGTPVLVFGYAWYRDCEGVFYTPTTQSCRAALAAIAAGYRVDSQKVRLFLHTVESASTVVDLGIGDRHHDIPHEENARRAARAIVECLNRAGPEPPAPYSPPVHTTAPLPSA